MAKPKVYLGYDDDLVADKDLNHIDFKVNKIGGKPNWPTLDTGYRQPKCRMCGFDQLLVVQCYAPLEDSPYHRTLYIFACVNVNCWDQCEGWTCIRSQVLDQNNPVEAKPAANVPKVATTAAWCSGADDWDELDDVQNGNFMDVGNAGAAASAAVGNRISDEDDESNSLEMETMQQELGNLKMTDTKNANKSGKGEDNMGAKDMGATCMIGGASGSSVAAAELEVGEEELVTVEDVPMPNSELNFIINQAASFPAGVLESLATGQLIFEPHFMAVEEEWSRKSVAASATVSADRVTELLLKYNKENGGDLKGEKQFSPSGAVPKGSEELELYEDVAPLHGDRLFHAFITRLQENPEQILRYSHNGSPLLGASLSRAPLHCEKCGTKRVFELQLMPSLSSSLRLSSGDSASERSAKLSLAHLHFLSVLVFTCSRSCWTAGQIGAEEEIIVQPQTY